MKKIKGIKIEKERIRFYIVKTILAIKKCRNVLAYKINTEKATAFIHDSRLQQQQK